MTNVGDPASVRLWSAALEALRTGAHLGPAELEYLRGRARELGVQPGLAEQALAEPPGPAEEPLFEPAEEAAALERLIAAERDPRTRAGYFLSLGRLRRAGLGTALEAIECFGQALDLDPSRLQAFEAIVALLSRAGAWKDLERQFRRMLHRSVGGSDPGLEFVLWRNLGLLYRDRLFDSQSALAALEMAARLAPEDPIVGEVLEKLRGKAPG